ncbi:hypothetical protein [Nocardia sp. NPDC004123]
MAWTADRVGRATRSGGSRWFGAQDPKTIKIENSIGNLQVWQATAGELDRHLERLVAMGLRRKAKQYKIIL